MAPPRQLLHYSLTRKLGQGGMGEVWQATDTTLNREVAIKLLPDTLATDPERLSRFEREARLLASLNHPNIATIHGLHQSGETRFLAMELVEGKPLSALIPSGGLPIDRLLDIAVSLTDALGTAHARGITHRDLKPDNVMISNEGRVKVLDFGLAKLARASEESLSTNFETASITRDGRIMGTVSYMSPEQAEGKSVDSRSDVFSLGILLFEMATSTRPFKGDSTVSLLSSVLRDAAPPVSKLRGDLPAGLDGVISRCLEKNPDHRYASAGEVHDAIESLRREHSAPSAVASRPAGPFIGWRAPVAMLVVLVALVAGWLWKRPADESTPPSTPASTVAASAPIIAVMGFENLSDPADADKLGRVLMGLITTDLAETGGLAVLSTARILSAIRQVGGSVEGGFDLSVAADAAKQAGAEMMLVGQVNRDGERITLAAELVDVASGRTAGSIRKEAGSARELFDLAGTIAADVRDKLGVSAAPGAFDLAGSLTSSPEAYRQYAAGEVEFHLGRFEGARRRFQEAVDLDPEFALAYYRLAMAQDWVDLDFAAAESIELGLEHAGRLPEHWQQQMRGYLEYNAQRFDSAYRAFSEIAAGGADIADTYYLLGEISMHASERWDPRRAAEYFEKALELDPTFAISIPHLLQAYRLADDRRAILDLLDRHGGSGWSDEHARMIESALFWGEKRFREYCHLLERTIETETLFLKFGYGVALAHIGEADRAIDFYDDILSYPQENALQIGAHHQRGVIRLWNGEFEPAVDDLDKTVELYLPQKDSRAVAAAHLSVARAHELRGTMDDALDAARRAVERDPLFAGGHYLLGTLYLKADRMDEAESTLARLDEIAGRVESPVAESWRDMLRAEIQLRRGHFDAALETIDRVTERPPVYRARPYEERLLARILTARGDRDEAIAAYRRVLGPPYLSAGEQWAPWFDWPLHEIEILPELARLEEAAGQVEQARQHYRTYLDRWGNADLELPAVATVRERLSRLQ